MTATRFPIRFDWWYGVMSSTLLLRPSDCYVDVDGDDIVVQMGWAFSTRFPRSAVASTKRLDSTPLSRGVHGFAGRWLVNGAGDRIVVLQLGTLQRARVLGVPVGLRELMVSVDDPAAVVSLLRRGEAASGTG